MDVDDIQHTYAAKEFERQVVSRLATQTDQAIKRLTTYTISGSDVLKQVELQKNFSSRWTSPNQFRWKNAKKTKGPPPKLQTTMVVECDLYLRGTDIKPHELFEDCAQEHIQLAGNTSWEQIQTTAHLPIILAEVAETPASLQAKLWQLERALRFGPGLQQAACCVVCLNADRNSFQAAAEAAKASLKDCYADFELVHFDVFAIWTEYRNVYAEIRNVKNQISAVQEDVSEVKKDVSEVRKDVGEIKDLLCRLFPEEQP